MTTTVPPGTRWEHVPTEVLTAVGEYSPWLKLTADTSDASTTFASAATATPTAPTGSLPSFLDALRAIPTDKEYVRPNGLIYVPRLMSVAEKQTVQDVVFVKAAYKSRKPILLHGDPGTGKTALFEAALPTLVTLQGTVETETADFVGSWVQNPDGTYTWVDGPLVVAMEEGRPLLIDEIALIDPRVMAIVYGVMDGRDELVVTQNPKRGVVKPKEGFAVFGACNPKVPGALMSDALLSRFPLHIEVTTDWKLASTLGIEANIIQVARNLHIKARSGEVMAPPQLRELLTYMGVLKLFGPTIALQNFVGQHREEDRVAAAAAVEAVYSTKATSLTI